MSEPTLTELTGVILRMAANYGRTFDDDEQLLGVVQDWAEQLEGFDLRDIDLARQGVMADSNIRYFPPVAEFRRRVQLARMDRRREEGEGEGCPACVGSGGTIGWRHEGTDDEGYEFVDYCPNGCKPPRANRPPDVVRAGRRRRRQQALALDDPATRVIDVLETTTVGQPVDF